MIDTSLNTDQPLEWVCETFPEKVRSLLDALDPAVTGPDHCDLPKACRAVLSHYHATPSCDWLRATPVRTHEHCIETADELLEGIFTFYGQSDRVPRRKDGGLDWAYRGSKNDSEWMYALNRHYHLETLLEAYLKTGQTPYAETLDFQLFDWLRVNLDQPEVKVGDPAWRGLEVSFRVKIWARVFHILGQNHLLRPATRLLILLNLPEHADILRNHHSGGNWMTMELSGLAMITAAFPEFREADAWMDYATTTLTEELTTRIYPDGAQHELASTYHAVALENFEAFAETCRSVKAPLPSNYVDGLERMWNYLAGVLRPDGANPLNNDSDRTDYRQAVLAAARCYHRPDWTYIATNGKEGTIPDDGPSRLFPWAGQMVFRSGWSRDDLWAFFDIGPWGTGHQHNDKLHLSVHARGRDLLVDAGRFVYTGEEARFRSDYGLTSRAHNVILIDGEGQGPGPLRATETVPEADTSLVPDRTFARGGVDHFTAEGRVSHTRTVVLLPGDDLVVVDRIETDRPRTVEALWHWHPACTVVQNGDHIESIDPGQGNLRIIPIANFPWETQLLHGQEEPDIQGWYSSIYNQRAPSTASVFKAGIAEPTTFAWLLLAARGEFETIYGEILEDSPEAMSLRISRPGVPAFDIRIPWEEDRPVI